MGSLHLKFVEVQISFRWCGVEVRRRGASSDVVLDRTMVQNYEGTTGQGTRITSSSSDGWHTGIMAVIELSSTAESVQQIRFIAQSVLNGGHRQPNGTTLSLQTNLASAFNTTMVGLDTIERDCCLMHGHIDPMSDTTISEVCAPQFEKRCPNEFTYYDSGFDARCHQRPSEYTQSTCSLNQWVRSLVGLITSAGTGEYFPPLQFTCRNCGGGDRGRVAIYRPFTCMVLKANDRRTSCPCHDEFRGPRSDYVRQIKAHEIHSGKELDVSLSLALALSTMQETVRFSSEKIPKGRQMAIPPIPPAQFRYGTEGEGNTLQSPALVIQPTRLSDPLI
ncbi:uncharacterized protein TNCV_3864291 [Trichonephila clavipes]|nr:uncharacterized protein TNCV_3864291 [Trichonephila clavipes]